MSFTLGDGLDDLLLLGSSAINGTGNALNNKITGNSGANRLDGGGGADTLTGGKGNDTYVVDNAGDKVVESLTAAKGAGIDTVESSTSFSLAKLANVEHLTLIGSGYISGTGNALANTITRQQRQQHAGRRGGQRHADRVDETGGGDGYLTLVTLSNVVLTPLDTANYVID